MTVVMVIFEAIASSSVAFVGGDGSPSEMMMMWRCPAFDSRSDFAAMATEPSKSNMSPTIIERAAATARDLSPASWSVSAHSGPFTRVMMPIRSRRVSASMAAIETCCAQ
jgi:hypothetical protein